MPRNQYIKLKRGTTDTLAGYGTARVPTTTPKYLTSSYVNFFNLSSISIQGQFIRVNFNPTVNITAISYDINTSTITYTASNSLRPGSTIVITGATSYQYNGTYTISNSTSTNFTVIESTFEGVSSTATGVPSTDYSVYGTPTSDEYIKLQGTSFTGGSYSNSDILDSFIYVLYSIDTTNKYMLLENSSAYSILSAGGTASLDKYSLAYWSNPFNYSNTITSITATNTSNVIKFKFLDMKDIYKPDIGDEIYISGWNSSSSTVNFNKSYIVTFVDKANNYFLANDSEAYNALTSGITITAQKTGTYAFNLIVETGEVAYNSDYQSLTISDTNIKYIGDNRNLKSGPIKFRAGRYYYPPCLGGNQSQTITTGNFYFVPFIVPNTTTFSEARIITKTNTSTEIGFAIYSSIDFMPDRLLVSGKGGNTTSTSNIFSLLSTNTNITNNTDEFNNFGLRRNTTGLQLPAGIYFLVFVNRNNALTTNSGMGYGVLPDPYYVNFFPAGTLVNTTQKNTNTNFPYYAYDLTVSDPNIYSIYNATTQLCPFIAMNAVSVP